MRDEVVAWRKGAGVGHEEGLLGNAGRTTVLQQPQGLVVSDQTLKVIA